MTEVFDLTPEDQELFEVTTPPPRLSDKGIDNRKDFYGLALNTDSEKAKETMEAGQEGLLALDANAKANESSQSKGKARLESILATGDPVDLEEMRSSLAFQDYVSPDFAAVLTENTDLNASQLRYLDRMASAERIIAEKSSQASSGFWAGAGYFADLAVGSVVHNVVGTATLGQLEATESGAQLKELAAEASLLMVSEIPPKDFEARFSEILDRVADAGLFTEENPFYLSAFLEMVSEGGAGMQSDLEVMFQFLDVASLGTSAAARSAISGVGKASQRARTISQFADSEAAKGIVVKSGDKLEDTPVLAEGTGPAMVSPNRDNKFYYTAPELEARRELEANNSALQFFKQIDFGPYVDPEIVEANKASWLQDTRDLMKKHKTRELDYNIRVDEFGNLFGQAYLGKSKGLGVYKTEEAAKKFADTVSGEVVRQVHEGGEGWVVLKEFNIPTEGLVDPTNIKDLSSSFFASIMSTTAKTDPRWDAILKQGEAKTSLALKELGREFKKVRRATKWTERNKVDEILTSLRDDVTFNSKTEPYTPREFEKRYEELYGSAPRQEVTDYYNTLVELNDIDYYINADKLLKEAVNSGEEMMEIGSEFRRVRKKDDWSDIQEEKVWNDHTNSLVEVRDLDPEKAVLREVDGFYEVPGTGFVRYVVSQSAKTRRLYHSDVLPYNAGGHRKYNTPYLFFLKQESKIKMAGGTETTGRPKTFMGVRFSEEGALAVEQINTVLRAIKDGIPENELSKLIVKNNDWNTSIENVADFKAVFDDLGLSLTDEVTLVPDGEAIAGGFTGKSNIGNSFRNSLNAGKRRGDRPLMGFGGNDLSTLSPTKSIERGFAQTIARRGEMSYLFNSIEGWLAAAKKAGAITNLEDIVGKSPRAALEDVKLTKLPAGRALETERQTIKQRLSNTTAMVAAEKNFLHAVASFAYNKNATKLAKALDWASTKDPAGFLRAMAFHTKLGLFNVDQLMVQANQIVNIVGVTSSTIGYSGAIRGALGVAPMRLALIRDIPQGALDFIAKTQAPFTGISAEDFIQLRDWIKASGRNIIDRTVVEENNPVAFVGSSVLDWGQVFFKEGELAARLTAATTNFLERKAAGFTEDIFDPDVTRSMIRRQDVLTASMTSASSAPWQRSLLAVPLQFTTYHVRMMEQLFTSRILTPDERIRLGLTHLMVYGTAAIPAAGFIQDKLAFEGKVDSQTTSFDLVRYGALDAILTTLSGEETALSTRLAVGEGVWDLMNEFATEPLTTLAAGPGGTITYDSFSALYSFLDNVVGGHFHHSTYDWNRFARNVSSYNKAYTFFVGRRYGEMVSRKTEGVTVSEVNSTETTLSAMGITLREQDALWTAVTGLQAEKEGLSRHIKELKRLDNIVARELNKPRSEIDYEKVSKFLQDIGAGLEILRPHEKQKALSRLRQESSLPKAIILNLIKTGHLETSEKLKGYISND